jgi:DNA-binding transcriptional MocR family regulator
MPNIANFALDRETPGSLKEKLRGEILRQIRLGIMRPGDRLPPSRRLADDLSVNRGTVSAVYDELVDEGVLDSHVGRGTFVTADLSLDILGPAEIQNGEFRWRDHFTRFAEPSRERAFLTEVEGRERGSMISFVGMVPDESLFPTEPFRKALNAVLKSEGAGLLSYGPPEGHDGFLGFLRDYLARTRGVQVEENQVLAVNGSQQALDLIGRAFLRPGDTVLVEEPSYYGALEIFKGYGARFVGVPVDGHGIRVEGMESILARERPKLIYVMPTFQNPTGVTLSPARREALVQLATRYEVPLIEDDFDGELYYDAPPPPALKTQPDSDAVIYIGTPSKILFPGLRIGWVAASEPVVRHLSRIKQVADLSGSQLLQAALARFAQSGALATHMTRVRETYGDRARKLHLALERHMPPGVTWTRPQGGLSILVSLPGGLDASDLMEDAAAAGVLYTPGRMLFVGDGAAHLRLTFGKVPTDEVDEGVRRLARVIRRALGRRSERPRSHRRRTLPPV